MFLPDKDAEGKPIIYLAPFRSKYSKEGQLFKRVHGAKADVVANGSVNVDFVIPYNHCLFAGAEIFGTELGDRLSFFLLDDANNTYSQMDVGTHGPNVPIMQFGFDIFMPGGPYSNTSDYDASLYAGMILRASLQEENGNAKTIYMNPELHEVVSI